MRNVESNSTVVGVPGRVVHQSGVKVNPLAHSALPDAEANVIKNLMDRIDTLENEILKLQKTLKCLANSESIDISKLGDAQNLRDKEIIESVIEKLSQNNLVNNMRYAEAYVSARKRKGFGPKKIAFELSSKGIDESVTNSVIIQEGDWESAAKLAFSNFETKNFLSLIHI